MSRLRKNDQRPTKMKLGNPSILFSIRNPFTGRPTPSSKLDHIGKHFLSSRNFEEQYISNRMSLSSDKEKYPYNLIDVDCNLLHDDLTSFASSSTVDHLSHFKILSHPSTAYSNIQAVFSPSSTIEEAERFHSILHQTSPDACNNIEVKMSVGVHPYHTGLKDIGELLDVRSEVSERIRTLLSKDKDYKLISCIGEMGLDYSEGFPERVHQLPWFRYQLSLAKEYNLPMFIHERLAFEDTTRLIDEIFPEGINESSDIIIHCFTGQRDECREYISRGYFISVSGYILKSGEGPEEVCSCLRDGIIPLERLMIETDAPYMGFSTCRDSYFDIEKQISEEFQALKAKKKKSLIKSTYPNVPSALPKVFEHVLKCLNEGRLERGEIELSKEDAAQIIYKNSVKFFGFENKII